MAYLKGPRKQLTIDRRSYRYLQLLVRWPLLTMHSVVSDLIRFGLGGFAAAIALQIAVTHDGYFAPIYSQFVFIGIMAIAFLFIPETPCEFWSPHGEARGEGG